MRPREIGTRGGPNLSKRNAKSPPVKEYVPHLLCLLRLKNDQVDQQFKYFLNLLKQLHINESFVEELIQMSKHAKFLKDFLTDKRKFEEVSMLTLSEGC